MPTPSENIEAQRSELFASLAAKYPSLQCEEFRQFVSERLGTWELDVRQTLVKDDPYTGHRTTLMRAEWDLLAHGATPDQIVDDLRHFKQLSPEVDTGFWERKCEQECKKTGSVERKKSASRLTALRRNEQRDWRKAYEQTLLSWQLATIQAARNALLSDLRNRFDKALQLQSVFEDLGIEPGVLWDTSAGTLCQQDIAFLQKWADYLRQNENVRKLCELMGRLRKAQKSRKTQIIDATTSYTASVPDIDSKEEIVGIELGNDLETVLPQELALLSDPAVSILFDLKFMEKRLMCFARQGYQSKQFEQTIQIVAEVADEDRMGPIILCIDTSGSMAGAPENIAKALALSLASTAAVQKRECFLINFSTSITTLDLTPPKGLGDLVAFLAMSLHGGTDVAPALESGLKKMKRDNYRNSDLLVISDFVTPDLSEKIVKACADQKEAGNKFYALAIGDFGLTHVQSVFDQQWAYNPQTGNIAEIDNVLEWVSAKRTTGSASQPVSF